MSAASAPVMLQPRMPTANLVVTSTCPMPVSRAIALFSARVRAAERLLLAAIRESHGAENAPLPANAVPVPVVQQREDYACGNAAALCLLRYWKWDSFASVDEGALYRPMQTTPAQGTPPESMAAFMRAVNLYADCRSGDVRLADLERAVDAREPPIVDLQAWRDDERPWRDTWDSGHYVVLVGYDEQRLFVMDPSVLTPNGYAFLPRAELEERWHDEERNGERTARTAIFVRGQSPRLATEALPAEATRLG